MSALAALSDLPIPPRRNRFLGGSLVFLVSICSAAALAQSTGNDLGQAFPPQAAATFTDPSNVLTEDLPKLTQAWASGPIENAGIVLERDLTGSTVFASSESTVLRRQCSGKPENAVCNDGNACTQNDVCHAGHCAGTAVTCPASDQCHAAGSCNAATGTCSNPALPDGTPCDGGDPHTHGNTCQAGVCAGSSFKTVPAYANGTLFCQGTTQPLANCSVTLDFHDSNGIVGSATKTTDATGYFSTKVLCPTSNNIGEHWVITSSCCSQSWTIASNSCSGNLGTLTCAACTQCIPVPPPPPLPPNQLPQTKILNWWPFDETVGPEAHDLVTQPAIAIYGAGSAAPTPGSGRVGPGLCFEGRDYAQVGDNSSLNHGAGAAFSFDMWINPATTAGTQTILDKRVFKGGSPIGYSLFLYNGRLGFQMADGLPLNSTTCSAPSAANAGTHACTNYVGTQNIPASTWTFVAVVVQGGTLSIYVNGTLDPSFFPARSGSMINPSNLYLGRQDPVFGSNHFSGCIDELEHFGRALSAMEIATLYGAGAGGKCKDFKPLSDAIQGPFPNPSSFSTKCRSQTIQPCDPDIYCLPGTNSACRLATFQETQWRVCIYRTEYACAPTSPQTVPKQMSKGLAISQADFRSSPTSPWVRVIYNAGLAELFATYHLGKLDFYDTEFAGWTNVVQSIQYADPGPYGSLVTLSQDAASLGPTVVAECRDRGVAWLCQGPPAGCKAMRRGQEMVLWGVLDAGNYDYITEYGFRDDGVVTFRVGSSGFNARQPALPDGTEAHIHDALWRVDIDLNGPNANSALLAWHPESTSPPPHAVDCRTPFDGLTSPTCAPNASQEQSASWNDLEFTTLVVEDKTTNTLGHNIGYHLQPVRTGTARHWPLPSGPSVSWTQDDFWVTRWHPSENTGWACPWQNPDTYLPSYLDGESVTDDDVVLWYVASAHHHPSDEDLDTLGLGPGVTNTHWFGFHIEPHNLVVGNPLGHPLMCEQSPCKE